jgi:hypothetical protein
LKVFKKPLLFFYASQSWAREGLPHQLSAVSPWLQNLSINFLGNHALSNKILWREPGARGKGAAIHTLPKSREFACDRSLKARNMRLQTLGRVNLLTGKCRRPGRRFPFSHATLLPRAGWMKVHGMIHLRIAPHCVPRISVGALQIIVTETESSVRPFPALSTGGHIQFGMP